MFLVAAIVAAAAGSAAAAPSPASFSNARIERYVRFRPHLGGLAAVEAPELQARFGFTLDQIQDMESAVRDVLALKREEARVANDFWSSNASDGLFRFDLFQSRIASERSAANERFGATAVRELMLHADELTPYDTP